MKRQCKSYLVLYTLFPARFSVQKGFYYCLYIMHKHFRTNLHSKVVWKFNNSLRTMQCSSTYSFCHQDIQFPNTNIHITLKTYSQYQIQRGKAYFKNELFVILKNCSNNGWYLCRNMIQFNSTCSARCRLIGKGDIYIYNCKA